MSNPLYKETTQNNMMTQFGTFMQNPMQFLMQRKINIPNQFQNDPHGAVQYLLNNGQMSQETFNKIRNMASQMGVNI